MMVWYRRCVSVKLIAFGNIINRNMKWRLVVIDVGWASGATCMWAWCQAAFHVFRLFQRHHDTVQQRSCLLKQFFELFDNQWEVVVYSVIFWVSHCVWIALWKDPMWTWLLDLQLHSALLRLNFKMWNYQICLVIN